MASIYDVENALVNLTVAAVYPNGTSQPSVAGVDVDIRPGWPDPNELDTILVAGKARVSVFKMSGMERNTSRYPKIWLTKDINLATLFLTVNLINNTITITGTVTIPQTCMVIVNNVSYAYTVLQDDTLNSIAAGIAALIPGASANNNVVTIPGAYKIIARVTVVGTSVRELKRQQQVFMIATWASTPQVRGIIADAIEVSLARIVRFLLPDSLYASLIYQSANEMDQLQKVLIYSRQLKYLVEYATTEAETDSTITSTIENITIQSNSIS